MSREIARHLANLGASMRVTHPDIEPHLMNEIVDGLARVARPDWAEGQTIGVPFAGHATAVGAGACEVGYQSGNRQQPFVWGGGETKTLGAGGGGGSNAIPIGLWHQSEGFPWLTAGSIVPMAVPNFAGAYVLDPGFPSLYQRRIGWSGMLMASIGSSSYILYLSTRYGDSADPSTTDALGIRINVYRISDATYINQCDIDFPEPFVSDPITRGWLAHRLGSFFYDPQDSVVTVALPMGLLSISLAQCFVPTPDVPTFTLTAWPTDSARASKDLSVSCAWNYALQHGWEEQDTGTPGPALRGYKRNRGSFGWEQVWTAALDTLCSTYTPALVLGSGQTDRYSGYYQENNRALFLKDKQRWALGITMVEDASWGGERLASGAAAVVITSLGARNGAVANRWALENDGARLEIVESSEGAFIAAETSRLAAIEAAQMEALTTTGNPLAFPPDGYKPTITIFFNPSGEPGLGYFRTACWIKYLSSDPVVYPAGRPGVVLPAPSLADDSVTPSYLPYNGKVRLVSGDDGRLYTVLFRARDLVVGYTSSRFPEPDLTDVHWTLVGESDYLVWVREPQRILADASTIYETLLICLDDQLVEQWRADISLKFLQGTGATIASPVWRNVWCWSARGRVIFVLRDYYPGATLGEELTETYYEPVLEIYRLSDQAFLHRISFSLDASHAHYNAIPRLTTGRIPSTEDEWAWAACSDTSNTVCMRVQMSSDLTDAPTVTRSTHGGLGAGSDAPIGLEFEHSIQHDGRFYWPRDFGGMQRST